MPDEFEVVVRGLVVRNDPNTANGKTFLIGQRRASSTHPLAGQWCIPEGQPRALENPCDDVVRQIREETGLITEFREVIGTSTEKRLLNSRYSRYYWLIWVCLNPTNDPDAIKQGSDWRKFVWVSGRQVLELTTPRYQASWPRPIKQIVETYYGENQL